MDDIIIPAKNEETAIEILEKVLGRCSEFDLDINWKKCSLLMKKVEFLGHIVLTAKYSKRPLSFKNRKSYSLTLSLTL